MILHLVSEFISGDSPLHLLLIKTLFSIVALLLVFPVHECAHGLTALALGDETAKYQGRLTLNPLSHVDLRGFLFLLLLGFGWAKPVQIDPRFFKNRRLGTILVSAAGPLSNVIFCFITYLIYGILSTYAATNGIEWLWLFSMLFLYMALYNATFAVFNLIPFPPLDGSKILGELLPARLRFRFYRLEQYSFIFFLVLILLLNRTGIIGILSNGLMNLFTPIVNAVLGGIFG